MTKFRKGDRVSVMGTVRHAQDDDDKNVFLDLDGNYQAVMIDRNKITLVHPHVEVGEIVWNPDQENQGTVLAVHDGRLWVQLTHGAFDTWRSAEVEILPAKQDEAA